jgi:hypothetical protein
MKHEKYNPNNNKSSWVHGQTDGSNQPTKHPTMYIGTTITTNQAHVCTAIAYACIILQAIHSDSFFSRCLPQLYMFVC